MFFVAMERMQNCVMKCLYFFISNHYLFLYQQAIFLSPLFKYMTVNECIVFRQEPVFFFFHHFAMTRGEEGQLANVVQNTVDAFDLTREINIL